MAEHLVSIENVTIGTYRDGIAVPIVHDATLSIKAGETLALVGESGSGKTLLSKSLLQLLPDGVEVQQGTAAVNGVSVFDLQGDTLNRYRGAQVGMVFQEPLTSLNPSLRIGMQLEEGLKLHTDMNADERKAACIDMLTKVKIAEPEKALSAFPHEFSGGMRQRIMLASVMLMKPGLLVADEPTTALDVMIQRDVMDIMMGLCRDEGTALLLISHDLALVSEYADSVAVMEKGVIVEEGTVQQVLANPKHSYTKKLIAAVPGKAKEACAFQPDIPAILSANDIEVHFPKEKPFGFWHKREVLRAVKGISLQIQAGETVALVGESGSGKSTLGRAILNLLPVASGELLYKDGPVSHSDRTTWQDLRKKLQFIFQDPFSSLDPRMRVGDIICEGLEGLKPAERQARFDTIMKDVGLDASFQSRFPHEMSGGQRQRVCIARALIMEPDFVVADEPVSALDVTVQAQVLELLRKLQTEKGFACLFITHDLAVVAEVADRVMVMYHGCVLEEGVARDVLENPVHPYTRKLLEAAPRFELADSSEGQVDSDSLPEGTAYLPPDAAQYDEPIIQQRFFINISESHRVACVPAV